MIVRSLKSFVIIICFDLLFYLWLNSYRVIYYVLFTGHWLGGWLELNHYFTTKYLKTEGNTLSSQLAMTAAGNDKRE
jgi:hypothetical protein